MKILVVGGGGREHAILTKLAQHPAPNELFCAPGNGGIAQLAQCVPIKATDIDGIVDYALAEGMDFVVVGPDDPLSLGLVDRLEEKGIPAFGPRQNAAIFEYSKSFAKEFMVRHNIPTARFEVFDDADKAYAYLEVCAYPTVVKCDGLALGKGVIIAKTKQEARDAVTAMMRDQVFGRSGKTVVIEECLEGPEVTVLAFTDGRTVYPMISSQDHKRALDHDQGLNTGGMGAFAPSMKYTPEIRELVERTIIKPSIEAMANEARLFQGILYVGLMLTDKGPMVIEYNARFGDPEAQTVLPLLKTDLLDIMLAIRAGRLDEMKIEWEDCASVCLVLASGGYPEGYETGFVIDGLEHIPEDIGVFHAATRRQDDGRLVTSGGRVLALTAKAQDITQARDKVYAAARLVSFERMHYRTDIGIK